MYDHRSIEQGDKTLGLSSEENGRVSLVISQGGRFMGITIRRTELEDALKGLLDRDACRQAVRFADAMDSPPPGTGLAAAMVREAGR